MRKQGYQISIKVQWLAIATVLVVSLGGTAHAVEENPLDVKRVTLKLPSADLIDIVGALNDHLRLPISFECRTPDPLRVEKSVYLPEFKVDFKDVTGRTALDRVTAMVGTHVWRQSKEPFTINLIPVKFCDDPAWALNQKRPEFKLEDASRIDAVNRVSELIGLTGEGRIRAVCAYSIGVPSGEKLEDNWMYKFITRNVTLTVKAGTVREAFNQIASAIGDAWWIYSEQDKGGGTYLRLISFYPVTPNVLPQPDPLLLPPE